MTIREFYEWAVAHGVEELEFGVSIQGEAEEVLEDKGIETCVEIVNKDHFEIGGYWLHSRRVKDFVWLNVPFNQEEEE